MRQIGVLIGGVFLVRLAYLVFFPVGLSGDESYYWDWGRRPDLGYYSKPPLIAWLMTGLRAGGWDDTFGIRFTALVLSTVSLVLLALLGRRLYDDRVAFLACLLAACLPASVALSLFLTIDAPLLVLWSAALLVFWNWLQEPTRASWLVGLGLILGLGYLAKQMMLVFPLLIILLLATAPQYRPLLRKPTLWLTLIGSLLFLLPPLIWNARNDWITFRHTGHHFEGGGEGPLLIRSIAYLGEHLG